MGGTERLSGENRSAARVAAAAIALFAGTAGEALAAGQESSATPGQEVVHIEKRMTTINANLIALMRRHHKKAIPATLNGQKMLVREASIEDPGQINGHNVYDKVLTYTKPGEKVPYKTEVLQASAHQSYTPQDAGLAISEIERISQKPRDYLYVTKYVTQDNKVGHLELGIGPDTGQHLTALDEKVLDDFLNVASTLVSRAGKVISD